VRSAIANSGGRYEAEHILAALQRAEMQVWAVMGERITAVVLTEVRTYPTGLKALNIFGVAGQALGEWKHLIADLEKYATESGCGLMEGCGRDGWGRAMGWTEVYRVVERRLV
jgi:hypothetical protein